MVTRVPVAVSPASTRSSAPTDDELDSVLPDGWRPGGPEPEHASEARQPRAESDGYARAAATIAAARHTSLGRRLALSVPSVPAFVRYVSSRDFSNDAVGPDSGPLRKAIQVAKRSSEPFFDLLPEPFRRWGMLG